MFKFPPPRARCTVQCPGYARRGGCLSFELIDALTGIKKQNIQNMTPQSRFVNTGNLMRPLKPAWHGLERSNVITYSLPNATIRSICTLNLPHLRMIRCSSNCLHTCHATLSICNKMKTLRLLISS